MTPAREAEAGGMTKVPQAWGLTAPARSHIFVVVRWCEERRLRFCPHMAGDGNHGDGETGNHSNPRFWNISAVA